MNAYVLKIAYDGTAYNGWQIQPNVPSITDILEKKFKLIFGNYATIVGASRTDAGVHAMGQVAVCRTEIDIPEQRLLRAWNNALPTDITIRSLSKTDINFHPRYNVAQKTYYYHFFLNRPMPFVARYGLFIQRNIDLEKLQQALQIFSGTHDFRSFCTGDECAGKTVRTINQIKLEYLRRYNAYRIVVRGQSFLRHMIRRIVGASLDVAMRPDVSLNKVQDVLLACNPAHALPNAPAQGLMLYSIRYKKGDK